MLVDLGVLEEFPSNRIPGFSDALVALLPTLEDHACSLGRRGGFITRLQEGTWAGHIAEHIALEFQNLAGTDVRHGKTRSAGVHGQYNCIYEYKEEAVGLEAGKMAVALVNHLVAPDDQAHFFDFANELERLIRLAERQAFGPSTQALIDEAVSRDIPFIRLDRHSLVQFGHGVHQQRIRATMTSKTSAIGVDIASDKSLTNRLLDSAGLPVPRADVVTTADEAAAVAKRLGFPCVVKPLDGNHGRGVHLDLRSEEQVRAAFPGALSQSRSGDVVVETYVAGNDYRCLVIGGKVAAIAERVPASVTGDGEHTVRQLVDTANQDPRRGIGHEKVLTRIKVDEAAEELVRNQGFGLDDVPPEGTWIKLALTGNMSTGGTSIDRTMEAHPDNVEIAETAAQVVGLDVAGIDFICPDITTPVRETGGAIVEVNAAPWVPDAHPPDRWRAAVRRPTRDRRVVPARQPIAHPDPLRDRHEREDDDGPDDRPHPEAHGAARRHDVHRRHRRRRTTHQEGRHVGAEVGPDGAAEPEGRYRGLRGGTWRDPAGGPWLRPQRRRGRHQRDRRSPGARRHRFDRSARQRQGRRGRGSSPFRDGCPQRRRPARRTGWAAIAPGGSCCSRCRPRRARTATTGSTGTRPAATRRSASSRPRRASSSSCASAAARCRCCTRT
jgi:D-alanine-D-alanine ligase-like ATP-grasp enzyme